MPAADASQCVEATIPKVPLSSGRVVNIVLILGIAAKPPKLDQEMFSFPRTVNEKAARVVAGGVAVIALVALVASAQWLLIGLALGFWARVLTGPKLSPLALLATRVVAPRLGAPKEVAGPPKRFAQGMGAVITTLGSLAWLLGLGTVADVLLVMLVVAATLESVFAYCLGCQIFGLLMRAGVVPEDVCAECADIWARA
jgi:hypothetical protein